MGRTGTGTDVVRGRPGGTAPQEALTGHLADLLRANGVGYPGPCSGDADDITVGRVFSVMAQQDYGFELRSGPLRDVRHPGTYVPHAALAGDPRVSLAVAGQAACLPSHHREGLQGDVHIPSAIMAEQAETKVPGEPLFIDSESGWRPYLPLMDEVLSALTIRGRPVRIVTSEGVTEMFPPKGILKGSGRG
ncbi:MAG: hypothetical protein MZV70_13740 [Desulfobacterales bacterium]|nr:hypothetical protein [Desulfobacterales bacterium]